MPHGVGRRRGEGVTPQGSPKAGVRFGRAQATGGLGSGQDVLALIAMSACGLQVLGSMVITILDVVDVSGRGGAAVQLDLAEVAVTLEDEGPDL